MKVMAQMSMVMNLDKCIGCHTCSVTCKQAWTNRTGVEYVWFNNVETRPGVGYPRGYEDQEKWGGGWVRTKRGRLKLRAGGRLPSSRRSSPTPAPRDPGLLRALDVRVRHAPVRAAGRHRPVARPKSLLTGKDMKIGWSANWDDDLAARSRRCRTTRSSSR